MHQLLSHFAKRSVCLLSVFSLVLTLPAHLPSQRVQAQDVKGRNKDIQAEPWIVTRNTELFSLKAPSLAFFQRKPHLVYRVKRSIYHATYDGNRWSQGQLILEDSAKTASPVLAATHDTLHMLFKKKDNYLYHQQFNGREWSKPVNLQLKSAQTNNYSGFKYFVDRQVALATLDDVLHLVIQRSCSSLENRCALVHAQYDGTHWTSSKIQEHNSYATPRLVALNNRLHLFWMRKRYGGLVHSIFDGETWRLRGDKARKNGRIGIELPISNGDALTYDVTSDNQFIHLALPAKKATFHYVLSWNETDGIKKRSVRKVAVNNFTKLPALHLTLGYWQDRLHMVMSVRGTLILGKETETEKWKKGVLLHLQFPFRGKRDSNQHD